MTRSVVGCAHQLRRDPEERRTTLIMSDFRSPGGSENAGSGFCETAPTNIESTMYLFSPQQLEVIQITLAP